MESSCNGAQDVCSEVKMLMEKEKKTRVRLLLQKNHPKQQTTLDARITVIKYLQCASGKVKKKKRIQSKRKVPGAATQKCS